MARLLARGVAFLTIALIGAGFEAHAATVDQRLSALEQKTGFYAVEYTTASADLSAGSALIALPKRLPTLTYGIFRFTGNYSRSSGHGTHLQFSVGTHAGGGECNTATKNFPEPSGSFDFSLFCTLAVNAQAGTKIEAIVTATGGPVTLSAQVDASLVNVTLNIPPP